MRLYRRDVGQERLVTGETWDRRDLTLRLYRRDLGQERLDIETLQERIETLTDLSILVAGAVRRN